MAKLIIRFDGKAEAKAFLDKVKKYPCIQGGNVFRSGTYRMMVYGNFSEKDAMVMADGHKYIFEQ